MPIAPTLKGGTNGTNEGLWHEWANRRPRNPGRLDRDNSTQFLAAVQCAESCLRHRKFVSGGRK